MNYRTFVQENKPIQDPYLNFVRSVPGKFIAQKLRLPQPPILRRYSPGQPDLLGPVKIAGDTLVFQIIQFLDDYQWVTDNTIDTQLGGLVFDASDIMSSHDLVRLHTFFHNSLPSLGPAGRVVILGITPDKITDKSYRVAQRALEGFSRSLAKELRKGATAQLVYRDPQQDPADLESTLRFLLSAKSAFINGQVFRLSANKSFYHKGTHDKNLLLKGRVALVTGAARGIGATIAQVLVRDGAKVIAVDVPAAELALKDLAQQIPVDSLLLDITAPDTGIQIAEYAQKNYGGLDILVNNAGITRDKTLVNMDQNKWEAVIAVNLSAQEKIINDLLNHETFRYGGAIITISSISGIAGNRGQTNYATTKAGVIGVVEAYREQLSARGITINAIAPGFIETAMTAAVPFVPRLLGRIMSTLQQGGLPIDVAEAVALCANPQSYALNGNTIRVCGQNIMGA